MMPNESFHSQLSLDPIIEQILPELQNKIQQDLIHQMQNQAKIEYQQELRKVQIQAEQEYQLAMQDLEDEGAKLLREKTACLQKDFDRMSIEKRKKEQVYLKGLESRFLSQICIEDVLENAAIKEIEDQVFMELINFEEGRAKAKRQKQMKEILIRLESKEEKIRIGKEGKIKEKVFEEMNVNAMQRVNKENKNGIAKLKSECNVKVKKIDEEIKSIREKNKLIAPKEDVDSLKLKFEELQLRRQQLHEKLKYQPQQDEMGQKGIFRNDSMFSHLDESSECNILQLPNNFQPPQHLAYGSVQDYSESEQDCSEEDEGQLNVLNPPAYHPSAEVSEDKQQAYQSNAPILRLNVAGLLRTNWEDPLSKYTPQDHQAQEKAKTIRLAPSSNEPRNMGRNNENDSMSSNREFFQKEYHIHLSKLNKDFSRKLTSEAKRSIIKSLAAMNKTKY